MTLPKEAPQKEFTPQKNYASFKIFSEKKEDMFNTNWHMQASWLGRLSSSWIIPTGLTIKASVSVGVYLLPLIIAFELCTIYLKDTLKNNFSFFYNSSPAVGSNPKKHLS